MPSLSVRVLLAVHHWLDPDAGAPGATLALGQALAAAGCDVDYFAYDHAFRPFVGERIDHKLRFPSRLAMSLARRRGQVDVVDAATGDAWLWASLRRPGGAGAALVTRAHGLEHVAHERSRHVAREHATPLSWKYPIYHGGFRLWEVRRSLVLADHCILLNPLDRRYVTDRLGVPEVRTSVIPNGIADHFHGLDAPVAHGAARPLSLAFIGRWTRYKGKEALVDAATRLAVRGVPFSLSVLGSGEAEAVLGDFPPDLRGAVSVTPVFANVELPTLLAGHEVFVFPTLSEGSSASLLEAMACGLAPVATAVGAAPQIVQSGQNGVLVDAGDGEGMARAVERLAGDRGALLEMRRRAQTTARDYRWSDVAMRTLRAYELALAARSTADTNRGPTLRHV